MKFLGRQLSKKSQDRSSDIDELLEAEFERDLEEEIERELAIESQKELEEEFEGELERQIQGSQQKEDEMLRVVFILSKVLMSYLDRQQQGIFVV